jgi:hypothetical protein
MKEGHQKPKRLPYMAKFKFEVVWCSEETGNRKAAAIFAGQSIGGNNFLISKMMAENVT